MTTKTTKEASVYEPRVGDLVTGRYVDVPLMVVGFPEDRIVACLDDAGTEHRRLRSLVDPLRPDAPGQRVRGEYEGGVFSAGVTVERQTHPITGALGFLVCWDAGGGGPWQATRLIRIADQAPRPETAAEVGDHGAGAMSPGEFMRALIVARGLSGIRAEADVTKEASMYEPRMGDLVDCGDGRFTKVVALDGDAVIALARGASDVVWRRLLRPVQPLRPDAPGQRVRCVCGCGESGIVLTVGEDGCRWQGGPYSAFSTHDDLIRIADQAAAAQVEEPGESAAEQAALAAVLRDPPRAPEWLREAMAGPTCQHCGSGIVAGLLRDTCPRGCDLTLRAKEPEPENVGRASWWAARPPGTREVPLASLDEQVWVAEGRGKRRAHPTREGAIAAWREAVRR